MDNTSKLEVSFEPKWERKNGEDRACANLTIKYDNIIINPKDTVYTYYFDDKPVKSLLDVVNPSTGVHNFKVVISYKGETKIVSKYLAYSKYGKVKVKTTTDKPKYAKNTTNFVVKKSFPFETAQIGQAYVTQNIKVDDINKVLNIYVIDTYNTIMLSNIIAINLNNSYRIFNNGGITDVSSIRGIVSVTLNKAIYLQRIKNGDVIAFSNPKNYPNSNFKKIALPNIINDGTVQIKIHYNRYKFNIHGNPCRKDYWQKIKVYCSKAFTIKTSKIKVKHVLSDNLFYKRKDSDKTIGEILFKKPIVQVRIITKAGVSDWGYYRYFGDNNGFIRITNHQEKINESITPQL